MCRRRYRSQCRSRRTNDGVNDPAVLPCRWLQSAGTGSFAPSLVVSNVGVMRVQSVPDERAARVRMIMCVRRDNAACDSIARSVSSCGSLFLEERNVYQAGSRALHHRVFDAAAVLGVVNALRFASTRPAAGPSGIDDASARHVSGSYAMVVRVMVSRMALTRESRRSMLASSRQCRTAHPPFAPRANGARIRPAPTGHGIERSLLTSPQSYLHAREL